jgi:hypothetical protein
MYYRFREELIYPYDELNGHHEAALFELYRMVFGTDLENGVPDWLITDKWQSIGFQGRNPRTDFRGAGILGLQCLLYFVRNFNTEFQAMRQDTSTSFFFFAITSINATHMLIVYLYLNKENVSKDAMRLRAGRKQVKRFCQLNALSK